MIRKFSYNSKVSDQVRFDLYEVVSYFFKQDPSMPIIDTIKTPSVYSSEYFERASVAALYSKDVALQLGLNARETAFRKFLECEHCCSIQNERAGPDFLSLTRDSRLLTVLHRARSVIMRILKTAPTFEQLQPMLGPGANIGIPSSYALPRNKLRPDPSCSFGSPGHKLLLKAYCPAWGRLAEPIESTAKLQFVPKNYKTDRPIVVEPVLNSFWQKGIGSHVRNLLRQDGLDIKTAQPLHRDSARRASVSDTHSTIDFSSASDLISLSTVRLLLPDDWFNLLALFRSDSVELDSGKILHLSKFSSMGNAYTFELETLIFYAIAVACGSEKPLVYGDDVIIEQELSSIFITVCETLGFKVNLEKSYIRGPFKESCGGDYHCGYDVRPIFLRDSSTYQSLYAYRNGWYRKGYEELAQKIDTVIPYGAKLVGPISESDGFLIGHSDFQSRKIKNGHEGLWIQSYQPSKLTVEDPLPGDDVLPYYSAYAGSAGSSHNSVRGVGKHVKRWIRHRNN